LSYKGVAQKEKQSMKFKLPLIAVSLSFIAILPKFLKNPIVSWHILPVYFIYIALSFLALYAINAFLWSSKPHFSHGTKFGIAYACGFLLLTFVHVLLFHIQPEWLIYFLNLKDTGLYSLLMITAFRTFIFQIIAYACLFFFKNQEEKMAFQQEIDRLNHYLNDLRNNLTTRKEYKNSILTRFQDKIIPVDISEIAFFHLSNGIVFQYLFSRQKYIQNETLESFENDLDPSIFYRANRQFLIHRKAVEKVEQIENRKLKVLLTQPSPEDIIISKAKSTAFIKWLEM
jgi:hypothetical protein